MANPNNNGTLIGRLASDPQVFNNGNGSHKVVATIAATNNYRSTRNGVVDFHPEYIPVERFYREGVNMSLGAYRQGDLVGLTFHLERQVYTNKATGELVYDLKVVVDNVWPLEGKSMRFARQAEKLERENAQLAAQPQTTPAIRPVAPAVPNNLSHESSYESDEFIEGEEEDFYGEPPF